MTRFPSVRRRTLHDERSEDTRARLLEATVESLVAVGYARTSATEIADRAGVSRGAQVYHYPTKAALVAAAVQHLLQRRTDELRQLFEELPPTADAPAAALDLLWRMFEGPTFIAWLEFVVASRTDAELREAVVRQSEPFVTTVGRMLRKYLPTIAFNPLFRRPDLMFALLDGVALAGFLYPDGARLSRMVAALGEIAEKVQPRTPETRVGSKGSRSRRRPNGSCPRDSTPGR
jgi:AcrR family transcriptional regulator